MFKMYFVKSLNESFCREPAWSLNKTWTRNLGHGIYKLCMMLHKHDTSTIFTT